MKILDQKNQVSDFTGYSDQLNLYFSQVPFLKIKNYGRTALDARNNAKKSFIGMALQDYSIIRHLLNREIRFQIE